MRLIKMPIGKRSEYVLSGLIFVLLLAIGVFHSIKGGINLTDEGLYLSAPFHYTFGVLPFRDAIHNATRQYDLLMAPIFIFFPGISLLQYRVFGVLIHLSSLIAAFLLFARFTPPLLVAGLCGVFFLANNFAGTPTPSYNVLVTTFGTWAFVFWMRSLLASTRIRQIIYSLLAIIALSLTIISNFSSAVVLAIPLVMGLGFWVGKQREYARRTFILTLGVISIFIILGLVLYVSGLYTDFRAALLNDAISSNMVQGGVGAKMLRSWEGVMSVATNSLYLAYVVGGVGIAMLLILTRIKKPVVYGVLGVCLTVVFGLLYQVTRFPAFDFVIVVFSLLTIPAIVLYCQKSMGIERVIIIGATLWSLIQVVGFGIFSTNALQATVKGAFFIFLLGVVSIYKLFSDLPVRESHERIKKVFVFGLIGMMVAIFGGRAADNYLKTNYLEVNYKKMTSQFTYPKLKGIYSVPEKVKPLEDLLNYLDDRVKPGDYFLAYNDLPLLYYLTNTKSIYPSVWSFEAWWPLEYRKKLFEKMLGRGKVAKYAVHMVTNPGYGWGTPVAEGKSFEMEEPGVCILCKYVEDNYVLEKFIFPFQIWRYGSGEKNEFLRDFNSYFEEKFTNWETREKELVHGELVHMPPFWLEAVHGRYKMVIREDNGEKIVRINFNGASSVYPSSLDISYFSGREGFSFTPTADEEVALTTQVRLSGRRAVHPYYSAVLFIQDRYDQVDKDKDLTVEEMIQGYPPLVTKDSLYWRTNSVAVYDKEWREYAVTRKLRSGALQTNFGITWAPEKPGDWIEIKNINFYTSDK